MPFFHERSHYAAIVAVLRAGDNINAKVRSNGKTNMIEVVLTDGSTVLWTNAGGNARWAYSLVRPESGMAPGEGLMGEPLGGETDGKYTDVAADADPEVVAVAIASEDYPQPAETVTSDG